MLNTQTCMNWRTIIFDRGGVLQGMPNEKHAYAQNMIWWRRK